MGTSFIVSMGLGTRIICLIETNCVDISTVESNLINKILKELGL